MGMSCQHCRNENVGQWQKDIGTKTTASQETGQYADAAGFIKIKHVFFYVATLIKKVTSAFTVTFNCE